MKRLHKPAALLIMAAVILSLTPAPAAAAGPPAGLGTIRCIPAGSGTVYAAYGAPQGIRPLTSAEAADVTVADYQAFIAAAAALFVARDTGFKVRWDGIGYTEANALLADKQLWEDIFSCDLPDTTSDLDYLRLNMRGTMQVSGWSYGSYAVFEFSQTFWTTVAQEAYVDETVDAILSGLNVTECSQGDKVRAIHDYIVSTVEYDDSLTRFSAYDALYFKEAVCNGYTLLLYKMLMEAGVPARAVSGLGIDGGRSENHAWNIVRIGRHWYNIDATWNDTARTAEYYLKSNAGFSDHIRDGMYDTEAFNAAHPMSPVDFDPSRDVTLIRHLSFVPDGGTYPVGTQFTLPVSVTPAGGRQSLIWSTSDAGVAAVSSDGLIRVLNAGEAVITAAAADGSGLSASFRLTAVASDAPSDWAVAYITALTARGVIPEALRSGYRSSISRGEFTALLVNVYEKVKGPHTPVSLPPFADIAGSPYAPQIAIGYELGVISGMSPEIFEPDGTLTREQCAKIISITAGLMNESAVASDAVLPFGDTAAIQSWAAPYVRYAYENGLMNGTGVNFEPAGTLTREEAMVIAERMLMKYGW